MRICGTKDLLRPPISHALPPKGTPYCSRQHTRLSKRSQHQIEAKNTNAESPGKSLRGGFEPFSLVVRQGDVGGVLREPAVVKPIHPLKSGELHVFEVLQGARFLKSSVTFSARALSSASLRESTEVTASAAARRSV